MVKLIKYVWFKHFTSGFLIKFQIILLLLLIIFRPSFSDDDSNRVFENTNYTKKKYQGIDVSHYQGRIDWVNVTALQDFVFLKASDGSSTVDPRFHENAQALENYKTPIGAYHFFEPSDDPIKQAQHYLRQIKGYSLEFRPVLDIEITSGVNASTLSKNVLVWLEFIEEKTGCRPIIYSNGHFWNQYLGEGFNEYDFWLADYNDTPVLPASRNNWQLWQFTDQGRVPGIKKSVDQSVFEGSEQAYKQLFCQFI